MMPFPQFGLFRRTETGHLLITARRPRHALSVAGRVMQATRVTSPGTGGRVTSETVLVQYLGSWLLGRVLWEYTDTRRLRTLVRYELPSGQIVRRLHWRSELRPACFVIELQLRQLA
jgi:hypothetical protein